MHKIFIIFKAKHTTLEPPTSVQLQTVRKGLQQASAAAAPPPATRRRHPLRVKHMVIHIVKITHAYVCIGTWGDVWNVGPVPVRASLRPSGRVLCFSVSVCGPFFSFCFLFIY